MMQNPYIYTSKTWTESTINWSFLSDSMISVSACQNKENHNLEKIKVKEKVEQPIQFHAFISLTIYNHYKIKRKDVR